MGDLYMSLIYTCGLNGVNPFDYLNGLQEHADHLATKSRISATRLEHCGFAN